MITSRNQLKEYALKALGKPVIQINVADEQLEDRIDDALDMFYMYHGDGTTKLLLKHKLTQKNIDDQEIYLQTGITSVTRVVNPGSIGMSTGNLDYIVYMSDIISQSFVGDGLGNYVTSQAYLNLMNNILSPDKSIQFVKYGHKIIFNGNLSNMKKGDFIIIECYMLNDPESMTDTWNDMWLKKYTTALFKKQWANNLIKYDGFQLPSGITISGDKILSEANDDIKQLEEDVKEIWEYPPTMMIG